MANIGNSDQDKDIRVGQWFLYMSNPVREDVNLLDGSQGSWIRFYLIMVLE